ncbi:MAG TPA: type VI secretion system baseplate subunit TssE [Bryobacteraceae bacterium]|nr:type VI secretion system baseplate subunit TssE [Bryobacteraceae bacterium]
MPRWEAEQTVTVSVIERLTDREPDVAAEPVLTRAQSVRQLKTSLRRDLEWLLNTRRRPDAVESEYKELEQSMFNYGLADISNLSWDSARDRVRVTRMIERTIATFEPRIKRLKVVSVESAPGLKHVLRFQIEGLLDMDPAPEHVSFDTVLQLSSGDIQIKGDPGA